jgi:hypothetical protein
MASGLANDRDPSSNGRSRTLREWLKLAEPGPTQTSISS